MSIPFSVLISVYQKENPDHFRLALRSIWHDQLLKPGEIVLIEDGPLTKELTTVIEAFSQEAPLKIVAYQQNRGLGVVLAEGIYHCSNEWIARMDSDDIATPERFLRQIDFVRKNPDIDIVGSSIAEFQDTPEAITSYRCPPSDTRAIGAFAKRRNPLNHMTVLFRKKAVTDAGNYQSFIGYEDYLLWIRMLINGAKMANISEPLVWARIGNNMLARRHGITFFKQEIKLQKKLRSIGFLNRSEYCGNIFLRAIPRLLPGWGIKLVYKFLRKGKLVSKK